MTLRRGSPPVTFIINRKEESVTKIHPKKPEKSPKTTKNLPKTAKNRKKKKNFPFFKYILG